MWGNKLLVAAIGFVVVVFGPLVVFAWNYEGEWKTAGTLSSLREEGVTYLEEHQTFVVAEGDRLVALSAVDPHLGHIDVYCPESKLIEGAHGEKFDRWGVYLAGPAPRGLDRVAVRVNDEVVEIEPTRITKGPDRGAVEPLDPEGTFCSP